MSTNEDDAAGRVEEHTKWLEAELFRLGAMHTELGGRLASALDNIYAASVALREAMDAASDAQARQLFRIPLLQTLSAAKEIVDGLSLGGHELQKASADRAGAIAEGVAAELARINDKSGE